MTFKHACTSDQESYHCSTPRLQDFVLMGSRGIEKYLSPACCVEAAEILRCTSIIFKPAQWRTFFLATAVACERRLPLLSCA